ncbi:unnamed protein product [Lactuca saligna]|uniref:Leucine-rich repeat-containing N-terminal plant-type domain-containing protein n=1 Tax=Lactuca saligna TaxID=75948 RepID=A0AA35Z6P3_LACSI|nr:unnamed protein product [Lactuca saligna]
MGGLHVILLLICITHLFAIIGEAVTPRETLEIIIGGAAASPSPPPPEYQDCPPPPPPPCPPTPPPPPPSPSPQSPPTPTPPPPPPSPSPQSPPTPTPPPPPPSPSPQSPPTPTPPPPPPSPSPQSPPTPTPSPLPPSPSPQSSVVSRASYYEDTMTDYKGFICDTVPDVKQKTISGVNLNNRNLYGPDLTLNEFLSGLKDLAFFHANSNNFTGTIPTDIGTLRYLYELDLSNNNLSGNFPNQVLQATKLVFLDLRFNAFFGVVPPQVFLLGLDLLFINNNNFEQTLPENLGSTPALYLTLANNKFVGGIPRSIGQASNTLLEVLFLNNQLTGCLPYEIGLLKKSTVLDVGFNQLTGPLPYSLQCLEKMELLNLANNKFYNGVPEPLCNLTELTNFTASYNYFTWVGPKCRELINKGVLDVKMNCIFYLPNQRSKADCAQFFLNPPSCAYEKSFRYVPCSKVYSGNQLEASNIQWDTPSPAPAPLMRSYGALSQH